MSLAAFPGAVSPFGVRLLGAVSETTRSPYTFSYESVPDTDPDPTVDEMGWYEGRGYFWVEGDPPVPTASFRDRDGGFVIRCVY